MKNNILDLSRSHKWQKHYVNILESSLFYESNVEKRQKRENKLKCK